MSKLEVSYTADAIVFLNSRTGKADKLILSEKMDSSDAIRALEKENAARESGSRASVSLLHAMLDNQRFDGYKGKTPLDENLPKELKDAMREVEGEFMKPIFEKQHADKGQTVATISKKWDEYIGALRAGSSYAVAKGKVLAYFAYCGKLPVAENGKLLTVAAIDKLLSIAKEGVQREDTGIAGKLIKISAELENHTESTKLGNTLDAIAALKSMLATFEGLAREDQEAAQRTHEAKTVGNVTEAAHMAIAKVKGQRVKGKDKTEPALI